MLFESDTALCHAMFPDRTILLDCSSAGGRNSLLSAGHKDGHTRNYIYHQSEQVGESGPHQLERSYLGSRFHYPSKRLHWAPKQATGYGRRTLINSGTHGWKWSPTRKTDDQAHVSLAPVLFSLDTQYQEIGIHRSLLSHSLYVRPICRETYYDYEHLNTRSGKFIRQ